MVAKIKKIFYYNFEMFSDCKKTDWLNKNQKLYQLLFRQWNPDRKLQPLPVNGTI